MHPQLRPPQDNDAAWLLEALNHVRTNEALVDFPHPYPTSLLPQFFLDDVEPWLQFVWLSPLSSSPTCSGISSKLLSEGDDCRIGYIWFSVNPDNTNAELSFLLHPHYQGQGLGLAQLPQIFGYLAPHMQANFKITNITAHVRPASVAAQKILQACGFIVVETAEYPTPSIGGTAWLQKWQFDMGV